MQIFAIQVEGARKAAIKFSAAVLSAAVLLALFAVPAHAQDVKVTNTGIDEPNPVTYRNMFEAYGGLNLMTFTAGDLPHRANLGGVEMLGTWWATHHIGVGVDARAEAGTTKATSNLTYFPLVEQFMLLGGAQWRGPHNAHVSLNYHGYAGGSDGFFNRSLHGANPVTYGLFPNQIAPVVATGISLDWNRSEKWAIRLTPDCYFTHFSTPTSGAEWEETFGIGLGVVYRFHDK